MVQHTLGLLSRHSLHVEFLDMFNSLQHSLRKPIRIASLGKKNVLKASCFRCSSDLLVMAEYMHVL